MHEPHRHVILATNMAREVSNHTCHLRRGDLVKIDWPVQTYARHARIKVIERVEPRRVECVNRDGVPAGNQTAGDFGQNALGTTAFAGE